MAVVVEDEPVPKTGMATDSESELFGFYEGTPDSERSTSYSLTVPDKITIYRGPHERECVTIDALRSEVRLTLIHELAHHIGINEQRVQELGWA